MNPESEAANQAVSQVIRIVGDGLDIALRLTGAAARETAILLYTALKSQGEKNKPGRQKLTKMLQTGTARIFDVPESKMKEFVQEAKRYGISYCVLRKSKTGDKDIHEVIVHEEDAGRISRIADKIKVGTVTVEAVPEEQAKKIPPMTDEDLVNGLLGEEAAPVPEDRATPAMPDASREAASERQLGPWEIASETEPDTPEQPGDDLFFGMEDTTPVQDSPAPTPGSTPTDPSRTQPDSLDALGLTMFSREGTAQEAASQPEEPENPTVSRAPQGDAPSGPFSRSSRRSSLEGNSRSERPSVREELEKIRREQAGAGLPAAAREAVHQPQAAMSKEIAGKGR